MSADTNPGKHPEKPTTLSRITLDTTTEQILTIPSAFNPKAATAQIEKIWLAIYDTWPRHTFIRYSDGTAIQANIPLDRDLPAIGTPLKSMPTFVSEEQMGSFEQFQPLLIRYLISEELDRSGKREEVDRIINSYASTIDIHSSFLQKGIQTIQVIKKLYGRTRFEASRGNWLFPYALRDALASVPLEDNDRAIRRFHISQMRANLMDTFTQGTDVPPYLGTLLFESMLIKGGLEAALSNKQPLTPGRKENISIELTGHEITIAEICQQLDHTTAQSEKIISSVEKYLQESVTSLN